MIEIVSKCKIHKKYSYDDYFNELVKNIQCNILHTEFVRAVTQATMEACFHYWIIKVLRTFFLVIARFWLFLRIAIQTHICE